MHTFKFVLAVFLLLAGGGCSFVRSEPARAEAKDQAGLDRLVAQIDEQLAKSGVERVEAGH